jgi:hypothetical protein
MASIAVTITGRILRIEECELPGYPSHLSKATKLVLECTSDFFSKDSNCAGPGREVGVLLSQHTYERFKYLLEPGQELAVSGATNVSGFVASGLQPIVRRANLLAADLDRLETGLATDELSRDAARTLLQRVSAGSHR